MEAFLVILFNEIGQQEYFVDRSQLRNGFALDESVKSSFILYGRISGIGFGCLCLLVGRYVLRVSL